MPSPDATVVAVIVTYNADIDLVQKQIESINKQCPAVYIDNGSESGNIKSIEQLLMRKPCVTLQKLDQNKGIAAAQNVGIRLALKAYPDCEYVLTLDHDSIPSLGMVETLVSGYKQIKQRGEKVAAVGPILFDPRTDAFLRFHVASGMLWKKRVATPGGEAIRVASLNSAGSLISVPSLREIGCFDEAMFIDHVETEWCFRAVDKGFSVYVHQGATMEHVMGDGIIETRILKTCYFPYRSPKRHYTIARNSMYLQRKKYVPAVWKLWNGLKLLTTYVYFGYFVEDSSRQKKCIRRGISDGWRGHMGPIPDLG